jgi:hypothetical protein
MGSNVPFAAFLPSGGSHRREFVELAEFNAVVPRWPSNRTKYRAHCGTDEQSG